MTITLYKTSSPVNKIGKTLTTLATVTGTPTSDISTASPDFYLSYSANALAANYMYVAEFGRYYFLKPPVVMTDGRVKISGDVDVLETYATGIKNAPATVVRSESAGLSDVPDGKLPINPNAVEIVSAIGSKSFNAYANTISGSQFCSASYVLVTGRGKN